MKMKSAKTKSTSRPAKKSINKKSPIKVKDKSEKNSSGDITSLILRDHEPIKRLILTLKDPEIAFSKKHLAYKEFERALSSHAKAEEESLYVHMKNEDDFRIEGLEGDTEHGLADQLMKEIDQIENDGDLWMAKVKVLAEVVDHHVKEEEKDVLKQVQKEFDIDTRIEIGKEYSQLISQFRQDRNLRTKSTESTDLRAEHV